MLSKFAMQSVIFPPFHICKAMKAKLCERTTFFGFILTQIAAVVTLFLKLSFWKPKPDDTYDINFNTRKNLLATRTKTTLKLFCQQKCFVSSTWFARARGKCITYHFFLTRGKFSIIMMLCFLFRGICNCLKFKGCLLDS